MKRCMVAFSLLCLVALALSGFQGFAKLASMEPETGKVGDVVTAKGENLDKTKVGEIYLTDGAKDYKGTITEQSDTEIKFKVPKVEAGRYRLMLLTANKASMIEQPVMFTVE